MPRAAPPAPSTATARPSASKRGTRARRWLMKPAPSVLSATSRPPSNHSVLAAPTARAAGIVTAAAAKAASLCGIVTLQPAKPCSRMPRRKAATSLGSDRPLRVAAVDPVLLQPVAVDQRRARMRDRPADDARALCWPVMRRSLRAPCSSASSGSSGRPMMVKCRPRCARTAGCRGPRSRRRRPSGTRRRRPRPGSDRERHRMKARMVRRRGLACGSRRSRRPAPGRRPCAAGGSCRAGAAAARAPQPTSPGLSNSSLAERQHLVGADHQGVRHAPR